MREVLWMSGIYWSRDARSPGEQIQVGSCLKDGSCLWSRSVCVKEWLTKETWRPGDRIYAQRTTTQRLDNVPTLIPLPWYTSGAFHITHLMSISHNTHLSCSLSLYEHFTQQMQVKHKLITQTLHVLEYEQLNDYRIIDTTYTWVYLVDIQHQSGSVIKHCLE